jgi:uncharacterized protein (UPF0333 family)
MKKNFAYRFIVILLAYVIAGAAVLGSMASSGQLPSWEMWTLLGVFFGAFIITVGLNEFLIYKRKNPTKK